MSVDFVDICMCADAKYLQHVVEVMFNISCIHPTTNINAHIITDVDIVNAKKILDSFQLKNINFIVYSSHKIDDLLIEMTDNELRFSHMTYARLLMFDILPKRKILYIDTDVLFCKPVLHELFNYDMDGNVIGAVDDFAIMHFDDDERNATKCKSYFNAGVMIVDLSLDESKDVYRQICSVMQLHTIAFKYSDQTILNMIFQSNYAKLHLKFNVLLQWYIHPLFMNYANYENLEQMLTDICVIHYGGITCPWKKSNIAFVDNRLMPFSSFYQRNKLQMIEYFASINKLNTYQDLLNL